MKRFAESRRRIVSMVRKELRQLLRDPRTKPIIFVAPVIQIILFGYAVNTDVRDVGVIVVDQDRTSDSRAVVQALETSGHFRIVETSHDANDIARALDRGRATLGLHIQPGLSEELHGGRGPRIQVLVDGSSSNTATIAQGYANQVLTDALLQRLPGGAPSPPVSLETRAWFNPSLESQYYNVPAVTGVVVFLMSLMLTSLAVVREKELGTLEQLLVSPLQAREMILGKTVPVAIIATIQLTLMIIVALTWFDVPFRGSFGGMALAAILYILAGLAFGLFISTISSTQQEAFMATFLLLLPSIILSGFMYPIESMPTFFQTLTWVNPVRHFLEIARGQFLRGSGILELWVPYTVLATLAFAAFGAAVLRFRKSLSS